MISRKEEIKSIVKEWAKKKFNDLKQLDSNVINPNPFLLRALGIKENTEEAYDFGARQRIERSMVTSFGRSVFEKVLELLDRTAQIEDIDLVFEKGGKKHYIQLKSGPEGFTRPALRKTRQTFHNLKQQDPDCVTVIAFAYGKRENLSSVWGKEALESADKILVGKEFWDYFFGDGAYEELLNIFEKAGKEALEEENLQEHGLYETLVKILKEKLINK